MRRVLLTRYKYISFKQLGEHQCTHTRSHLHTQGQHRPLPLGNFPNIPAWDGWLSLSGKKKTHKNADWSRKLSFFHRWTAVSIFKVEDINWKNKQEMVWGERGVTGLSVMWPLADLLYFQPLSLKMKKDDLSNMTNAATKHCKFWGQQERIFSDYTSEKRINLFK